MDSEYTVSTLCEVCRNALGKCSWSEYGKQTPVEGWEAIRMDVVSQARERREESYIVLACPQYAPDEYAKIYPFNREKAERRAEVKARNIEGTRRKAKKREKIEIKEPLREMNSENRHTTHRLEPCPRCGMDSGKRMQTETVPERFFVVCLSCGYTVGPCGSPSAASVKWDKEYRNAIH